MASSKTMQFIYLVSSATGLPINAFSTKKAARRYIQLCKTKFGFKFKHTRVWFINV